jgi:hypothetical protein
MSTASGPSSTASRRPNVAAIAFVILLLGACWSDSVSAQELSGRVTFPDAERS